MRRVGGEEGRLMASYSQITSLSSSTGLSAPSGMRRAVIEVEGVGAVARYRTDGTAPTASVGHLLKEGDVLEYTGDLSTMRFILSVGSPILNVTFDYG
jgi:hypothetical protein